MDKNFLLVHIVDNKTKAFDLAVEFHYYTVAVSPALHLKLSGCLKGGTAKRQKHRMNSQYRTLMGKDVGMYRMG